MSSQNETDNMFFTPEEINHVQENLPAHVISEVCVSEAPKDEKQAFYEALMRNLIKAKLKYPKQYNWPDTDISEVFMKLAQSCREGTYSRHNHAIRWTCKELGIEHSREAIDAIFNNKKEQ
jgi:hypothetical protein